MPAHAQHVADPARLVCAHKLTDWELEVSYTFPALRGHMGSTPYYHATIRARELAAVARLASELPQWTEWSIFERFQRDLAEKRIRDEIVPYLVRTRDRFFNSVIVLVFDPAVFEFESLLGVVGGVPTAYREVAEQMGFLTVEGGDLVVLDGQHRLAALRQVVTAGPELQGEFVDAVTNDEIGVLFIRHETFEKTRRIFNKVNRYARPTSASDNIITSEDDGAAIVSRWLVEPEPPLKLESPMPPFRKLGHDGEPLVEWRKEKLTATDEKFTTLSALYQTTQAILASNGIQGFTEKHLVNRPSDETLARAYHIVASWWAAVMKSFKPYQYALRWPTTLPRHRSFQEPFSLLFRPIGQVAFVEAILGAEALGLSLEQALRSAEKRSWSASDGVFCDTIVFANGRMNAREAAIRLAGRLGTYLVAGKYMDRQTVDQLHTDLAAAKGIWDFRLPKPGP